ncbi:phage virion morphogenesis protein [Aeromonas hydrophila]|uniref:phage virion morphogenesis protein n=1 Tax=Aeromonas hydrophila TaxID=644 RepID=UPI003D25A0EC
MITVNADNTALIKQLKLLELPPKKRQRLVWRAARELQKLARSNNRKQQDWNGKAWAPRKKGSRKMLQGLAKLMVISEPNSTWPEVFIRFEKGRYKTTGAKPIHAGVIGSAHQHGSSRTVTAAAAIKSLKRAGKDKPATRSQAKKLRALGYKRPGKRKGKYVSASLGWITENLNSAQASVVIKKLKGEAAKTSWTITIPARPFLGANSKQREQAFARALQGINYGWDVNKQALKRK